MSRHRKRTPSLALAESAISASQKHNSAATSMFGAIKQHFSKQKEAKAGGIKQKDLTFILRNLATLLENGVSLPKALATLAQEKGLEKYAHIFATLRRKVETGETFSSALATFPQAFNKIIVHQVKVGEHSGTLSQTITQLSEQQENSGQLRSQIKKRLAYPIVLVTLGSGVIVFMLMYVIPTFEETYASAGIDLPFITQFLIDVSAFTKSYGWIVLVAGILTVVVIKQLRKNPAIAHKMDLSLLTLPLMGNWLRDIAVLQLMDVLGNLMEAGFTLAEALRESADSVNNRAVKAAVEGLQRAVRRGERFGLEVERHGEMFPPIVSQLVIVGEKTGNLTQATVHIRAHLRREIERKTNLLVGTIEPVLTISLAAAIAVILLAIYLPMFDMIKTVG